MSELRSQRLWLVPWTATLARLALEDGDALAGAIGAAVPGEWPQADFRGVLPLIRQLAESSPQIDLANFLAIHRQDNCLIGGIGFTYAPTDGEGEFGYDVIPSYQGQGYATEMGQALISWAFSELGLARLVATCLPTNLASCRVLEKLGLRRIEEAPDLTSWQMTRAEWLSARGQEPDADL
ncbi:MAG: GNAT family N-acetyltransferase [Sulfobacillus sp.]